MHRLSSIRQARIFSSSALLPRFSNFNWISEASSNRYGFLGCLKSFCAGSQYSENVGNLGKNLDQQKEENASSSFTSEFGNYLQSAGQADFRSGEAIGGDRRGNLGGSPYSDQQKGKENVSATFTSNFRNYLQSAGQADFRSGGNIGTDLDQQKGKENVSATFASNFRNYLQSTGQADFRSGGNFGTLDFMRAAIGGDRRGNLGGSPYLQSNLEHNADFVNIKLMRNNTFVTVTDSKGNKKCGASSGHLGGSKVSRYAAEATAEHVGRLARSMGIKSVVVRVKGFTHFKKKRQAIVSFCEGFSNSRLDRNPVVYIEDTTRRPHNGCRLPKRRRV